MADATNTEADEPHSVSLVYDEMHRTLAQQQDQIKTLDSKASFFLTSASIVVGFAGLRGVGTDSVAISRGWLIPAIAIYGLLVWFVIEAYKLRGFSSTGLEPLILPDYMAEHPDYSRRQFIATLLAVHTLNVPHVNEKIRWLWWAQRMLVLEVGYLVVALIGHTESRPFRWVWNALRESVVSAFHWLF